MATPTAPTRQQYMNKEATHAEYYSSIADEIGVTFRNSAKLPEIKKALAEGDKHLNSIPLRWWDMQAQQIATSKTAAAFKSRGDYATRAGLVCVLKEAARKAASEEK